MPAAAAIIAGLAQQVEQPLCKRRVAGSIPAPGTSPKVIYCMALIPISYKASTGSGENYMAVSVVFGWWVLPTAVTVGAWLWYFSRPTAPPSSWVFGGRAVEALVYGGAALTLTLFAWLIYFAGWALFHG